MTKIKLVLALLILFLCFVIVYLPKCLLLSQNVLMFQKNALLAGAATGALASAVGNNKRDKIVQDAITGGAIATAAQFINYLT